MTDFSKAATELQQMEAELTEAERAISVNDKEALLTLVPAIQRLQVELETSLSPRMDKFRKRCTELDPVTNQPRYGEQMRKKVEALLADFGRVYERAAAAAQSIETVKLDAEREAQEEARRLALRAEEERQRLLAAQEKEEKVRAEATEEEARRRAQEEAELHALALQAEKAREERLAKEAAEAEAVERERARLREEDEALVASVPRGVPGVEQSLELLRQSCADPKAYRESVGALHLYIHNVIARPEDLTFRRIKHDNAHFRAKVSGYSGGIQCLIAAGFKPQRDDTGAVVYVVEEPDFEKDHKAWTDWYDAIKEVRDRLLEESSIAKKMR